MIKPAIHLYWDAKISEGNKLIKTYTKRKCHSFTKNFLNMILQNMGSQSLTYTDTAGASRTPSEIDTFYCLLTGAVSNDAYGSVIGTGIGAVNISDTKLGTQIAHGVGAGQLQYSATTFGAPITDASSTYMVVTRVFTNATAGTITPTEIGLYVYDNNDGWYFCIVRDLLVTGIPIAAGQNLTLNYTIKVTI